MNLNDFDALSFDCYGTLIDWESGIRVGLQKIADLSTSRLDLDVLLETYGACEAEVERSQPGLLYPEVIARSAIAAGAIHGIDVPEPLAAEIGQSVPDWPAFPDSAEALARLKQRYKLIILSNVDRESFAASNTRLNVSFDASNTRLNVSFDAILTAQDIGSYKPCPANFDALLAKLHEMSIPRDRLLHVAQSLFHDHVPAKAIGLPTVWIDRRSDKTGTGATPTPGSSVQPDWTFTSMGAFADAVESDTSS
jgi:2-haloalkanoic acid dehalogenase type II